MEQVAKGIAAAHGPLVARNRASWECMGRVLGMHEAFSSNRLSVDMTTIILDKKVGKFSAGARMRRFIVADQLFRIDGRIPLGRRKGCMP